MTEIHAFDPDGTPSPGAQAALTAATASLASRTDLTDAVASIGGDERSSLNRVRAVAVLNYRETNDVYPQGFAINRSEGHYYVAATQNGGTLCRITRLSIATGERVDHREIQVATDAYPEGFHYWRGTDGNLKIALFTTGPDANNDSAYAILDYETGTLGSAIPIRGKTRMNRVGDYVITTDSPATAMRTVFVYDRASIEAGTPDLRFTIPIRKPGYVEKVQGIVAVGSTIFFPSGAVDAAGPSVAGYDWTGQEVVAQGYSRRELGELINAHTPGTVEDPSSDYRLEFEGGWADGGRLYTGAAVNTGDAGRFVIFEHNVPSAAPLSVNPLPQPGKWTYDNVEGGVRVSIVREGHMVALRVEGTLDAPIPATSGANARVATGIPSIFRPASNTRNFVAVSTGTHQALAMITSGGSVTIYNYSGTQINVLNGTQVVYRSDL